MRCDYHKDREHEVNKCRSLKFVVERLIKSRHLRRYIREVDYEEESTLAIGKITTGAIAPLEPRAAINYILGGPLDDQYQSKHQQNKLLREATVKAQVNVVQTSDSQEDTKLIDGPISFSPVKPNRVIIPH